MTELLAEPAAPAEVPARLPGPLMNAIGGLLLLALAVWLWIGASDIDGTGTGMMTPDGFPRLVAVLLGLSSLLLVLQSCRAALTGGMPAAVVPRHLPVVGAIVLIAVYPAMIVHLGFYLATAVWMAPFLLLAGMRSPVGIGASIVGFLLFTKVLFDMVLGTPMP